jgi:hypothetical protein
VLDVDLRAAFASLCNSEPAGCTDSATYEETLGLAVEQLMYRTRGSQAGGVTRPVHDAAPPALDCPFITSVMALSSNRLAQELY